MESCHTQQCDDLLPQRDLEDNYEEPSEYTPFAKSTKERLVVDFCRDGFPSHL